MCWISRIFVDGRDVGQGVLQLGVVHIGGDLGVVEAESGYE